MDKNEQDLDSSRAEAVAPPANGDPKVGFCAWNPAFVDRNIKLWMKFNSCYKGIVLAGACPRCTHVDGISLFVPTSWATVTPAGGSSVAYVQHVAAPIATDAPEQQAAGGYEVVEGRVSGTEPGPVVNEYVEVIVCRCGQEHLHQPPAGRSGCGYWAYLRLPKETTGNVERAR